MNIPDDPKLRVLVFRFTRRTQRKTMPDYYKAVYSNNGITPVWKCDHKHETRMEAFDCALNMRFGKREARRIREKLVR